METKLCPKCKCTLAISFFLDDHRRYLARCQNCQAEHRKDFQIRKQLKKQGKNQCKDCKEIKPLIEFKIDRATCKSCDCAKTNARYHSIAPEEKARRKSIRDKIRISNPAHDMWKGAKQRARENNLPFEITEADIVVPELCPVLGIKMQIGIGTNSRSDNSPSLDKIIPNRGYVKDNIQVISYRANRFKSNASLEELKKVVEYMQKFNQ